MDFFRIPLYEASLGVKQEKAFDFFFKGKVLIDGSFVALRFFCEECDDVIDVPISLFPDKVFSRHRTNSYEGVINPFFWSDQSIPDVKFVIPSNIQESPVYEINKDWSCPKYRTIFYPHMCYRTKKLSSATLQAYADISSLIYDTDFIQSFAVENLNSFCVSPDGSVDVSLNTHLMSLLSISSDVHRMVDCWTARYGIPNSVISNGTGETITISLKPGEKLVLKENPIPGEYVAMGTHVGTEFYNRMVTVDDNQVVGLYGHRLVPEDMYPYNLPGASEIANDIGTDFSLQRIVGSHYSTSMMGFRKKDKDVVAFIKFAPIITYTLLESVQNACKLLLENSDYISEIRTNDGLLVKGFYPMFGSESLKCTYGIPADMNAFNVKNQPELIKLIRGEALEVLREFNEDKKNQFRCLNCIVTSGTTDDMLELNLFFQRNSA